MNSNLALNRDDLDLPTSALERWKYTNLPRALDFSALSWVQAQVSCRAEGVDIVRIADILDDMPAWVDKIFGATPPDGYPLWSLCNRYLRDGLIIDVPDNTIVSVPVEIFIVSADGGFTVPRTLFRLGKNAQLTVIEHHTGEGAYWKNRLTQIEVGPGAIFRHYRVQQDSAQAVYTQTTSVTVDRGGVYEASVLTLGAALSRNDVHAVLAGEGAEIRIGGATLLRGGQQGDSTILIEHRVPRCRSNQLFKTVLDDTARGVYQGKVHVWQDAQKTDGYQLSNALLLSEGSEMDTKPELEIYADDVKCSHGATTGRLDDDHLFYLRARGIPEKEARAMLIEAFVAESFESIAYEPLRDEAAALVKSWLLQ